MLWVPKKLGTLNPIQESEELKPDKFFSYITSLCGPASVEKFSFLPMPHYTKSFLNQLIYHSQEQINPGDFPHLCLILSASAGNLMALTRIQMFPKKTTPLTCFHCLEIKALTSALPELNHPELVHIAARD